MEGGLQKMYFATKTDGFSAIFLKLIKFNIQFCLIICFFCNFAFTKILKKNMLTASWAYPHHMTSSEHRKQITDIRGRVDLLALRLEHIGIFYYVLKT